MKTALVLGAGGFIGGHLVKKLKSEGFFVRGVDLKYPEFSKTGADDFIIGDLRDSNIVSLVMTSPKQLKKGGIDFSFDEVYQLAADMGGAGFIFTGDNDANIMHNSALINLNVAFYAVKRKIKKIFYSSSACIYPLRNQLETEHPNLSESSAYPADPDSEYGWEKIFSERLYLAFKKNYNLNVKIARFHNIFGPEGTWNGGREKSPAAICRKIANARNGEEIEIWGDGNQTRSFLYIDECLEGMQRLMNSDFSGPLNIGSDEMVSINQLVDMISSISLKNVKIKYIDGPLGVRGRNSDNTLIKEKLNWCPTKPLYEGLIPTYKWILEQVKKNG